MNTEPGFVDLELMCGLLRYFNLGGAKVPYRSKYQGKDSRILRWAATLRPQGIPHMLLYFPLLL